MKVLKWIGIGLAALVGLVILAVAAVYITSSLRFNRNYDIRAETIEVPAAPEILEKGQHIAVTRGCVDCHGQNLGGGPFIEDPAMGYLYASNLTSGLGGIGETYTDEDWVRAIRHGVGPDGKPLIFMPSSEYYFLTDEDLGALIAYIKTVPPVDYSPAEISVGPLGRALYLAGQMPLLVTAEEIDHDAPRPEAAAADITAEYGQYLAVGCVGCHRQDYTGGPIAGVPPDWPPARNLTPAGELADWTEADFIDFMRTGVTPTGENINPEYMPWSSLGQLTDNELKALWLFLQSLPPKKPEVAKQPPPGLLGYTLVRRLSRYEAATRLVG